MTISPNNSHLPNQIPFWFKYGAPGIILMFLGVFIVITLSNNSGDILSHHPISLNKERLTYLDTQTSRFILRNGMPALERNEGEDDPFTPFHLNWAQLYWKLATNLKNASPLEILRSQLPNLALVKIKPANLLIRPQAELATERPLEPEATLPHPAFNPTEPEIFIYHTHTSESYLPVSGEDHRLNEQGDIVQVGTYLQRTLEERYGIKTVHNETIHDQFPFRESYQRSQRTIIQNLKEYPNLKVVLDVHRDATPGIASTCKVNNKSTATIMIVVGSDKMGLSHPKWHQNLSFANRLVDAMNVYYPGLSSGIVISDARYNQHLNDHALIIEFGDQNSRLEEVYHAVDLFSSVLIKVLNEENLLTVAKPN